MLTVTATDLGRLMACNGSRLMGGFVPSIDAPNQVTEEGNAADWLVSQVFNGKHTAEELIDRKAPNGVFITADMVEHLDAYLKAISIPGTQIERDTSHSNGNWQINGRCDSRRYDVNSSTLHIGELKYGWGIIEPENNWTLISHAIKSAIDYGINSIQWVTITIYQPRPDHPSGRVRSWTISKDQLVDFWYKINDTLSKPTDICHTGSHCKDCPGMAACFAFRKAEYNAIDASERAFDASLDNNALSIRMDEVARAIKVLTQQKDAYEEQALHRLKDGQIINNYSIEHELTNTVWLEHVTPDMIKILTGIDASKKQLVTPGQAKKLGVDELTVKSLTERRRKGLKLARVDANIKAQKMFNTEKGK